MAKKNKTVKELNVEFDLLSERIKKLEEKDTKICSETRSKVEEIDDIIKGYDDKIEKLDKVLKAQSKQNPPQEASQEVTDKSPKTGFKCEKCDKSLNSKKELKMHQQLIHPKRIKCQECEQSFVSSIEYEVHMKSNHKEHEQYLCDDCEKTVVVKWRLNKHKTIHSNREIKKCHFFNNKKLCPFEEMGCMYLHVMSPQCFFQENCQNTLCQFQHDQQIKCSECEYLSTNSGDIEHHIYMMHRSPGHDSSEVDLTVEENESDMEDASDDECFPCDSCENVYNEIEELINHYAETAHNN